MPIFNESRLRVIYEIGKMRFRCIRQRCSDDFINNVTQTDGSKVSRKHRLHFLGIRAIKVWLRPLCRSWAWSLSGLLPSPGVA